MASPKAFNLFQQACSAVIPAGGLTVSEWADKHRVLSSEASAEPGKWRTSRVPYSKEWMDVFNDPYVHTVVLKTSSQVGKSETLNNVLGYFIHHDPCPIMMIQPTIDRMKEYSKKRIAPMIRDTPVLSNVVADEKSRDSDNTTLGKSFTGGHLKMVGANAASALASDPIRTVLADEIDRYPKDVDGEGDPLSLAIVRTTTFSNRKIGITSTPTIKDESRIEEEFSTSHQFRYHVPCPQCETMQTLRWKDDEGQNRLVWEATEDGKVTSISYVCDQGCAIENHQKLRMLDAGEWLDENGKTFHEVIAERDHNGRIGFEINALYSVWLGWAELAERFLNAVRESKKGKPELLKTFVNTMLGETWDPKNERPDVEGLENRAEDYGEGIDVPMGSLLLTAGVDTQPNRLEVSIWGWGLDDECWLIYHEILWGDTTRQQVWKELEELLTENFRCEREDANGDRLTRTISAACIDSGGHNAEDVKNFTKLHRGRQWLAIFGKPTGAKEAIVTRPTRNSGTLLWAVGSSLIKDKIFPQLKVNEPGPGYVHFPLGTEAEYFAQLTAEKRVKKMKKFDPKDPYGHSQYVYKKIRDRNEALDCMVYAYAAKEHLRPNFPALLEKENLLCVKQDATLYSEVKQRERFKAQSYTRTKGGFVSSWSNK